MFALDKDEALRRTLSNTNFDWFALTMASAVGISSNEDFLSLSESI
jgi:hypothetical protein